MMVTVRSNGRDYGCETAKAFFEKMRGLMFSGKKNILFVLDREGVFAIHSFFVFFPFDAVYIDAKGNVVDAIRGIAPFTPYLENRKPAKYLLELCEPNSIRVGDRVDLGGAGLD